MKKKYFILALTFLSLLIGQTSYCQDWEDMGFDDETTDFLNDYEDQGGHIDVYDNWGDYTDVVNNDDNPYNDWEYIDYIDPDLVGTIQNYNYDANTGITTWEEYVHSQGWSPVDYSGSNEDQDWEDQYGDLIDPYEPYEAPEQEDDQYPDDDYDTASTDNGPVDIPDHDWNTPNTDPDPHITNEITDPCLKSAVERIINDKTPNAFTNMINGTFFREDDQSLVFTQYYDNSVNGIKTDGMRSGNMYNQTITLNFAALDNASQEYIVATIYHEILHAYLLTQGTYVNSHHEFMANSWRDDMANQLRIDFPNLSQADADALAWGGLNETTLWQTMKSDDIRNNTGITGAIAEVNNNFKNLNNSTNGNYGTPCAN